MTSTRMPPAPAGISSTPPGGFFLLGPSEPGDVFTPERLGAEQLAVRDAIGAFVEREVTPRRERLEARDYAAHRELLALLGRDGYVGIEVPEAYGGAGLDQVTATVVAEAMAPSDPFAVTFAAHTGIGTLPTAFFGTDEQKARWLPGLASGELVAAYALTEPGTGSDVQAIRTRATRQEDGSFRIDGAKQFITNAGFADLFTVYARVGDEGIAAFLVPRETPGLGIGPEEHKMGIQGSSTCPVLFDGAVVPADALLGEVGQGHRIAFNVLNVGRFKLAVTALGAMRPALATAVAYAMTRSAFGRPIARFPLVAAKLTGMSLRIYAVESLVYRIAGLLDARLAGVAAGASSGASRAALEEYAVECSIAKILASEELGWVVDELVQVHGGYGYLEAYPAARAYRDSRINRIWEGTNEINRLLIPGTLIRRAVKGRIDLLGPARRAQEALLAPASGEVADGPLAAETALVDGLRQATLLLAGAAFQRHGVAIEEEQELLAGIADLAIQLLTMESSVLRARAAVASGDPRAETHVALARLVVAERASAAESIARGLVGSLAEGDEGRMLASGLRRILRAEPIDRIRLGRGVAEAILAAGGHPL